MGNYSWNTSVKLESVFDNPISIPEYQREYSWSSLEADDFFSDLDKFTKSKENEYLFGQFIFYKEGTNNTVYVIDGQQRLVTTAIFISAARNIVKTLDIDRDSDDFNEFRCWIKKVIGKEDSEEFTLTLNGKANNYFRKNIQMSGGPENGSIYKATKNIYAVYKLFESKLYDIIADCGEDSIKFGRIYKLVETLMKHFLLSTITTEDLSQAYVVFETLNSRGKDLEASDLLKNYLFGLGSVSIKDDWNEFTSVLSEENESVTQYIRTYWNSHNTLVRQRQIYRTISKGIDNKKKATDFVKGLTGLSKYYMSMTKPNSYNEFNDKEIEGVLINLKILGTKLFYPIILACVETKTENKLILMMLKTIESLTVRNIIIGPDTANKYEELFCEYARNINENEKTVNEVIVMMRGNIFTDDIFKHNFEVATVKDTSVSRYILASIYNTENGPENIINPNSSAVNVEHIMPRKITKWPEISEDDHEKYLYYLGNQTLLKSDENTRISNDPFLIKKETYAISKIPQNHYFENIGCWCPEEIEKRQKSFIGTAIQRWSKS